MSRNYTETERFLTREEREARYGSLSPVKLHLIRATTQELTGETDKQGRQLGRIIYLLHHSPKRKTIQWTRSQP